MITFLRKALSSWIVLALLGLVLVAFIVTGVQDPFGGGSRSGALATVGGARVTEAEFAQAWQRAIERLRQSDATITPERAAREGAVEQLVDQMLGARGLEAFAQSQGIVAGTRAVDAEIAAVPAFQFGGRFSQQAYEQALASQRLTDREVREGLRGEILRRQLLAPVALETPAARGLAEPYARLLLEQREGLIGVVPTAAMQGAPAPSPEQLTRFYASQRARFTIPERRVFRYAVIDPARLAARVTVGDAEANRFYAANAERFGGIARRRLAQAVVPDQAVARRLVAAARGGQPFAAAAQAVAGLAPGDLALGEQTRAEFAGATNAAVAAAAFTAPVGAVTDPVRSDFGWHVVAVESASGGAARPLAEVRAEIDTALRAEKAATLAADIAERAQDALGDGASFADVARRLGLAPVTSPAVTSTGAIGGGRRLDEALTPLVTAAFQSDAGDDASIEDIANGRSALFELTEVLPAALPPLASVRDAIAQAWTRTEQLRRARALAETIAAEARAGTPLATALASRGLPPPQPVGGRRVDLARAQGGQVPPPVVALFALSERAVRTLAADNGAGYFVIQAVRVTPGDVSGSASLVAEARTQFGRYNAEELAQQFARAAQAEVGTRRNEPLIARTRDRLAGVAEPSRP